MKKGLNLLILFLCIGIFSITLIQSAKIEVITSKESFQSKEKISLKASLFDDNNNLFNDDVLIILKDAENKKKIEKTIKSNKFVDIDLGEDTTFGFWTVNAIYKDSKATAVFVIEKNENPVFELKGDKLTITNMGNTRYAKTVQIIIGDSVGTKEPNLDIGESVTYRLIAPDGNYNIKITDGKNTIFKKNVRLTGRAIGVLNEGVPKGVFLASGISNLDKSDSESSSISYEYLIKNKFIYIFIVVVIAAAVLLSVERIYKLKSKGKSLKTKPAKKIKKKKL